MAVTIYGSGQVPIQVVSTQITTEFTFSSATYADVTNFNLSITPFSASSKVLVLMSVFPSLDNFNAGNTFIGARILRGSTTVYDGRLISGYGILFQGPLLLQYLDSPSTTSSTTYKLQVAASSTYNNSKINPSGTYTPISTITLMEISG